jgi:hypothetical protein
MDKCDMCKGELIFLGLLGSVAHFSCRGCGMTRSKELEAGHDEQ